MGRIQKILEDKDTGEQLLAKIDEYRRRLLSQDTRLKGYEASTQVKNVKNIEINKEAGIEDSLWFEFVNEQGDTVYVVAVLNQKGEIEEAAFISEDRKIKVNKDYAEKMNEAAGRKVINPDEERYLLEKDEDADIKTDGQQEREERTSKAEEEKKQAEKTIGEKEEGFEARRVIDLEKGADTSFSDMLGKNIDKCEKPQLVEGKDRKFYVIGIINGKHTVLQGPECTPVIKKVIEAFGGNNIMKDGTNIKGNEMKVGKTGERGNKVDVVQVLPDGKDKGDKKDWVEFGRDGKVITANVELETGGKKIKITGRQAAPIQDKEILLDGKTVKIKREIPEEAIEESKKSKSEQGEDKGEKVPWPTLY